jgi:hypothetical protein
MVYLLWRSHWAAAAPCTMHSGGVSCSVTSSAVNPTFPQSPGGRIPCNGFWNSQQQARRDLRSLHMNSSQGGPGEGGPEKGTVAEEEEEAVMS